MVVSALRFIRFDSLFFFCFIVKLNCAVIDMLDEYIDEGGKEGGCICKRKI